MNGWYVVCIIVAEPMVESHVALTYELHSAIVAHPKAALTNEMPLNLRACHVVSASAYGDCTTLQSLCMGAGLMCRITLPAIRPVLVVTLGSVGVPGSTHVFHAAAPHTPYLSACCGSEYWHSYRRQRPHTTVRPLARTITTSVSAVTVVSVFCVMDTKWFPEVLHSIQLASPRLQSMMPSLDARQTAAQTMRVETEDVSACLDVADLVAGVGVAQQPRELQVRRPRAAQAPGRQPAQQPHGPFPAEAL